MKNEYHPKSLNIVTREAEGQLRMHKFVIYLFAFLFFVANPAYARINDTYEQVRISNKQIEDRLAEWNKRANLDYHHMNISNHPKVTRFRNYWLHSTSVMIIVLCWF